MFNRVALRPHNTIDRSPSLLCLIMTATPLFQASFSSNTLPHLFELTLLHLLAFLRLLPAHSSSVGYFLGDLPRVSTPLISACVPPGPTPRVGLRFIGESGSTTSSSPSRPPAVVGVAPLPLPAYGVTPLVLPPVALRLGGSSTLPKDGTFTTRGGSLRLSSSGKSASSII